MLSCQNEIGSVGQKIFLFKIFFLLIEAWKAFGFELELLGMLFVQKNGQIHI